MSTPPPRPLGPLQRTADAEMIRKAQAYDRLLQQQQSQLRTRTTLDTAANGVIVIFGVLILTPIALIVLFLIIAALMA